MPMFPILRPLVLGGMLSGLLPAQDAPSVERAGEHFRVVVHHGALDAALANRLAGQAESELQRLWAVIERAVRTPAPQPAVLHLYRLADEYLGVEKAQSPLPYSLVEPAESPLADWSNKNGFVGKDGMGHLQLAPDLSPAVLAVTGLPQPTKDAMLRVAAQLVFAPLVKESDVHDFLVALLAIGTAEAVANPTMAHGVDAAFDGRRQAILNRRGLGHSFTLDGMVSTHLDHDAAWQWHVSLIDLALVAQHLRQKDADWAGKLLAWKPRSQRRGEHELRKEALGAVLGRAWTREAAAFRRMIDAIDPQWFVLRGAWTPGKRAMLAGSPSRDACIGTSRSDPGSCAIAARVELGPGSDQALGVLFEYGDAGTLNAFFGAGSATISLQVREPMAYHDKAHAEIDIRPGRPFDMRVEARKDEMRLLVDGTEVCSWKHGLGEPAGFVNLFVWDRVVWLENLVHEPLGAPAKR